MPKEKSIKFKRLITIDANLPMRKPVVKMGRPPVFFAGTIKTETSKNKNNMTISHLVVRDDKSFWKGRSQNPSISMLAVMPHSSGTPLNGSRRWASPNDAFVVREQYGTLWNNYINLSHVLLISAIPKLIQKKMIYKNEMSSQCL